MATPFFKNLDNDQLKAAYREWRTTAYNWSQMSTGAMFARPRQSIAAGFGRALRNVEIIEAIARQRRLNLFA